MKSFAELEYEIQEANSEIARHHRDFEKIREILSRYEALAPLDFLTAQLIGAMRGIVG